MQRQRASARVVAQLMRSFEALYHRGTCQSALTKALSIALSRNDAAPTPETTPAAGDLCVTLEFVNELLDQFSGTGHDVSKPGRRLLQLPAHGNPIGPK